jgi:superfamily I DNA and/or RNA helicase
VETPEIRKGTSRINMGEVEAVTWILKNLTGTEGYKQFIEHWTDNQPEEKEIGVITFYGEQARLLKNNIPEGIPVRVSPVDRFQGMERNIVIVSLVRSNLMAERIDQEPDFDAFPIGGYPSNESLGFAESPNRLNVALSRAKRLLIVVGNRKHFERKEIYKRVIDTIIAHEQCEMWDYVDGNIKQVKNA